jgi:uncharacterized protein (TIGR02246 family)
MKSLLFAGALALGAGAQGWAQETPDALLEAFIAAIETEDSGAVAALFAEDADSYSPGTLHVRGRAAIAADWQGFFDAFDAIELDIELHGSAHAADIHAAWGVWTMTQTPADGGEPFTLTGRFMDVQRQIDGRWLYLADHASISPGPADSGPE